MVAENSGKCFPNYRELGNQNSTGLYNRWHFEGCKFLCHPKMLLTED